jgi:ssRNA-specific RNase YbeY (16S rRNA maturation enzyme)
MKETTDSGVEDTTKTAKGKEKKVFCVACSVTGYFDLSCEATSEEEAKDLAEAYLEEEGCTEVLTTNFALDTPTEVEVNFAEAMVEHVAEKVEASPDDEDDDSEE